MHEHSQSIDAIKEMLARHKIEILVMIRNKQNVQQLLNYTYKLYNSTESYEVPQQQRKI